MAVAVSDPVDRSFPFLGSDMFGGFGFDQALHAQLGELADQIGSVPVVERGRISLMADSDRVIGVFSLVCNLVVTHRASRR